MEGFLTTARRLAKARPSNPRQADLRRAVSTAYYALFHAIARNNADLLVGVGPKRPNKAWRRLYRSIDHGPAKKRCGEVAGLKFPPGIVRCANTFVALQEARHLADYDPTYSINQREAQTLVGQAGQAIKGRRGARRMDRRASAVRRM